MALPTVITQEQGDAAYGVCIPQQQFLQELGVVLRNTNQDLSVSAESATQSHVPTSMDLVILQTEHPQGASSVISNEESLHGASNVQVIPTVVVSNGNEQTLEDTTVFRYSYLPRQNTHMNVHGEEDIREAIYDPQSGLRIAEIQPPLRTDIPTENAGRCPMREPNSHVAGTLEDNSQTEHISSHFGGSVSNEAPTGSSLTEPLEAMASSPEDVAANVGVNLRGSNANSRPQSYHSESSDNNEQ